MSMSSTAIVGATSARPLRHWSGAQLDRARDVLERVWAAWSARWHVVSRAAVAVNACDAPTVAMGSALTWERGRYFWLSSDRGGVAESLQALLFARPDDAAAEAPIAQALANEAAADLLHALGQLGVGLSAAIAVTPTDAQPLESDARRWSGAIRACFDSRREGQVTTFHLHLGAPLAAVLCGGTTAGNAVGRPPLSAVTDAIATRPLGFQVCLDETSLTLGTLQSLRVGDVLTLSHHLDQPLRVAVPGASREAAPFCAAYLGRSDHHRAVELVSAASASNQIDP